MKLKRTNWYYMAGLLPGTMLNICLGMYLARNILLSLIHISEPTRH